MPIDQKWTWDGESLRSCDCCDACVPVHQYERRLNADRHPWLCELCASSTLSCKYPYVRAWGDAEQAGAYAIFAANAVLLQLGKFGPLPEHP